MQAFSAPAVRGDDSSCGAQASHCGDFSRCAAQASVVGEQGSVAPACGIFPDRGLNP